MGFKMASTAARMIISAMRMSRRSALTDIEGTSLCSEDPSGPRRGPGRSAC